jgi:tetratricopeptide (TPR) repeat protein
MILANIRRLGSNRAILTGIISACVLAANQMKAGAASEVEALLAHGDSELRGGHYSIARQYFLSALAYDRDNAEVLLKVAQAEAKLGDLDSAIKRARLVTQIEPKYVDGHRQLGRYLEANRDPKAAELQYERAMELTKDQSEATSLEGKAIGLLIDLDDLDRADRLSLSSLKGNKKNAECHFFRGLVLSKSEREGRMQDALKEFKQTLALAPQCNIAHYQSALLYLKLGQKDEAKQELETFIKNHPPKDQLEEAKDKLENL